jgi:hypothetical protein
MGNERHHSKILQRIEIGQVNSGKLPGYRSNNKRRIPGQITGTGSTKQTFDKEKSVFETG